MINKEGNDGWQIFCSFCLSIKEREISENLDSYCVVCRNTFNFQGVGSSNNAERVKNKYNKAHLKLEHLSGVDEMPPEPKVGSKLIFEPTRSNILRAKEDFISRSQITSLVEKGSSEDGVESIKSENDGCFVKQLELPTEASNKYLFQSRNRESEHHQPIACSQPKIFMSSSSGALFRKSSSSEFSIKPVSTRREQVGQPKTNFTNQNFPFDDNHSKQLNQSHVEYLRTISFNEKTLKKKIRRKVNSEKQFKRCGDDKLKRKPSDYDLHPNSRKTARKKVIDKIRYSSDHGTEIYLKSKCAGGDIKIFIEGEELRVSNSRNPRPLLYPASASVRKTAPGNFAASGMVAPRRDTSSNALGINNYSSRKPVLFQKPYSGSVNSKSTTESNPLITNMTSMGLMNAIQPSPSNQKFNAVEAEPPMLSPIRSKIQTPKNFFYREFQAIQSESRLAPTNISNSLNQMKSNQEHRANNSIMGSDISMNISGSEPKPLENPAGNADLEDETEMIFSGSDSSDSSFGSVTLKGKQTNGTYLDKWQTEPIPHANRNFYGRKDLRKGNNTTSANKMLMQDFSLLAYIGYDVAKSIIFFLIAASFIWTCSALIFEVVPFPMHFRDTLYELMSYKKPEPKYGLVVWINKVFRLITKMIGVQCNP